MSLEEATPPAVGPRPHSLLAPRFDREAAAVVSILLGIVQLLLAAPLYYADVGLLKKLFILPLLIGTLIVAAGSITMANVRSPNRYMRQGCFYSNVAGLLGAVLALCLYIYSLGTVTVPDDCIQRAIPGEYYPEYPLERTMCIEETAVDLFWYLTVILLCYDVGAILLSLTAVRALRST